ncbi:uncharacterized protein LOC110047228 [Orbicella faveolata]|uniref:uncharacterized protein LOC110047226 n=1 Tax=Orbicella faveolata TaxID=48498 RepID=UPI0009E5906B|nr:uncharacterized protein LOC110047226 [Orbicella faveolata]XP_020608632.1 uncharacterized protein LOC110047227 [Orbicella faveolata]XP_020608633.1 uncharacterized protein LOC110047228 [Orbicella faveolata]
MGVLLFFCTISVLLGLALVAIYGFFIVILWNIAAYIPVYIAIASMFATLGILETVTGIWSAVCCCRSCCALTRSEPEQQFLNPATDAESVSTGEFMTQRTVSVAMVIPVQGDDSCDATQEWSGLLPAIPVPTFGATGNHPQPVGAPMSVPLQAAGVVEVVVQASESVAQGGRR